MSKLLRKQGWRVLNDKAPHRKRTPLEHHLTNRKNIFKWITDEIASQNGGKLLDTFASRGLYRWSERSRGSDQSYFYVRLRGNHIVVTRQRYLVNGEGANAFMMQLGVENPPTEIETKVLLRHPCMDYKGFRAAYMAVSPELEWWEV